MCAQMGHHIIKWAKLNFVARHYDPYVHGHKVHDGVRRNLTWPICFWDDLYSNEGELFDVFM